MASAGVLDLNSQVQAAEGFPHMQEYGAYLQGDDDEAAGRGHVSGPQPLAHHSLWECQTSVLGEVPAGRLEVH